MGNTYSANLVTESLKKGALTILQNKFSPLRAIARTWEPDPVKPRATCEIKFVKSGATTQKNATNFETSGDSVIDAIPVTIDQYSQSFQISNADLQGGLALDDLVKANVKTFCSTIMGVVLAPVTVAKFTAHPAYVSSAAAFGFGDMAQLRATIKKADEKNLILDGEYFGAVTNQPGYFQPAGTTPGDGWKPFGWDFIGENTDWAGAGAGVRGLALSPQALGVVCGLPAQAPNSGNVLQREVIDLPELGIKVAAHTWFSLNTRSLWCSLDLMLGAHESDITAAVLIKDS